MFRNKLVQVYVHPQALGRHRVEDRREFELVHHVDERREGFQSQLLRPRAVSQSSEENVLGLGPELLSGVAELDVASPELGIGPACWCLERSLKCGLGRMHVAPLNFVTDRKQAAADAIVGNREGNVAEQIADRIADTERSRRPREEG